MKNCCANIQTANIECANIEYAQYQKITTTTTTDEYMNGTNTKNIAIPNEHNFKVNKEMKMKPHFPFDYQVL